jgi:hypothetical protein
MGRVTPYISQLLRRNKSFEEHLPIHIRCLSTNRQHPAAQIETLECPIPRLLGVSPRLIPVVAGDLLALLFNKMDGSPGFFALWRWTTGRLLLVSFNFVDW